MRVPARMDLWGVLPSEPVDSRDEVLQRYASRYNLQGNGTLQAAVKIGSVVLCFVFFAFAFAPFGTSATGTVIVTPAFLIFSASTLALASLVLLVLSIASYWFAPDPDKITTVDENRTRPEDRRFGIYFALVCVFTSMLTCFLMISWGTGNLDLTSRDALRTGIQAGSYGATAFSSMTAAASVLSILPPVVFAFMFYVNSSFRALLERLDDPIKA